MAFVRACSRDELWDGELLGLTLAGRPVLLIGVGGAVRAYEDRCAHKGVPLSSGRLSRGVLTCAAHEWQYDAATGRGLNPAQARLRDLPVRVVDGDILVDVGPGGGGGAR